MSLNNIKTIYNGHTEKLAIFKISMQALPESATMLNNYTVIMLGPRGSGKTVFLASMYKKLSIQGDLGFFLEVDSAEKRKRLKNIYTQVALEEKWPRGTSFAEISEWNFSCKVQNYKLAAYPACEFTYLDYAGGRLTDEMEGEDISFENKLKDADALLGLLDGQKIRSLMCGQKSGNIWMINDLPNILEYMQTTDKPIHFLISKWDIIEGEYTLDQVKDKLLEIDEFKNIIKLRNQADTPVRLIPVSSVGLGFAELQPDGSMKKKTDQLPQPYQVEIPLACVLPDMIKKQLNELMKEKEKVEQEEIEVKPNLNLWDRLKKIVGGGTKFIINSVKEVLPRKYQFANSVLEQIMDFINEQEAPIYQKEENAKRRTEELKRKKEESLREVEDQESALNHSINCFMSIVNQLESQYPNSRLKI